MRFLPVSWINPNRLILLATASLVVALGCEPGMRIDAVVEARSCTDNAQTMILLMNSTSPELGVGFTGGSSNVKGIPQTYSDGSTLHTWIMTELDHVNLNEKVTVKFYSFVIVANTLTVSLADVAFYKSPWYTYPTVPDCAVTHTPQFTVTQPVPHRSGAIALSDGVTVEVTNPNPLPMTLVALDLVESPDVLDPSSLDWDAPAFNALPWQAAAPGGATLDAAAPPLAIDLPGTASGRAILCRFISVYDGMEVRGIMQASAGSPLADKPSTWGGVKALYR
jgi:hypothetical protein